LEKLDKALHALRQYDFFCPDADFHHYLMSMILISQGKLEEALEEAEKERDEFWTLLAKHAVFFAVGKNEKSDNILTRLINKYGSTAPVQIAYVYAFRKENDLAFKWLDTSFSKSDLMLIDEINYPAFRNLWSDPGWSAFLTKMKLPKDHWLVESLVTE